MKPTEPTFYQGMKRFLPAIVPVAGIYLIWFAASFIVFHVEVLVTLSDRVVHYLVPVAIIGFVFIASYLTLLFIVYVEDFLEENLFLRLSLLGFTILVSTGVYLLVLTTGVKNNVLFCISTANLIVFACTLATWMTEPVKRPAEIVPLCGVVAFADLFSVFAGPTKHMAESVQTYYETGMKGVPPLVDFFLVKIALPGYSIMMPVFGISDWIIIAFLSAVFVKFDMNDNLFGRSAAAMKHRKRVAFYIPVAAAGLIVAIAAAQMANIFIPALPFVIVVFLVYSLVRYPSVRQLKKREWQLLIGFSTVMVFLLVAGLNIR